MLSVPDQSRSATFGLELKFLLGDRAAGLFA